MSTCSRCGKTYNSNTVSDKYDNDETIQEYGLVGTYINFEGYCVDCAVDMVLDSYPQGLEDMSYHIGDD